jgi:hypothetical protein
MKGRPHTSSTSLSELLGSLNPWVQVPGASQVACRRVRYAIALAFTGRVLPGIMHEGDLGRG